MKGKRAKRVRDNIRTVSVMSESEMNCMKGKRAKRVRDNISRSTNLGIF